jgi:putative isomerase
VIPTNDFNSNTKLCEYAELIIEYAKKNYRKCFREPDGNHLAYRFIVPGSTYSDCLWDWDCWLTNLALHDLAQGESIYDYEKGCILNFLDNMDEEGRMPIFITPTRCNHGRQSPGGEELENIHKPCIAQHTVFVIEQNGNDCEWIREKFHLFERFIGWYEKNCKHESGLFVWIDDCAIGVDNDPCTFYRPKRSSASIYLNSMMHMELMATARLCELLGYSEKCAVYKNKAEELKDAIQEHCWDERDGCFYSADVMLLPIDPSSGRHKGCPRHWSTLIQRIDVWSNFMPLWAGIATPEQAQRIVSEHYKNEKTFNAPYGVRTLSKAEKMYAIIKSGNPSCWLGPIWGISNYMVFDGLRKYGYTKEARLLAEKTITLFGKDIESCGELHEYYHPDTGEGVNNPGFQNWNLLSLDMIKWLGELSD